jgi:hypothetical protein
MERFERFELSSPILEGSRFAIKLKPQNHKTSWLALYFAVCHLRISLSTGHKPQQKAISKKNDLYLCSMPLRPFPIFSALNGIFGFHP